MRFVQRSDFNLLNIPEMIESDQPYIKPLETRTVCGRCGNEMKPGHRCPDKKPR